MTEPTVFKPKQAKDTKQDTNSTNTVWWQDARTQKNISAVYKPQSPISSAVLRIYTPSKEITPNERTIRKWQMRTELFPIFKPEFKPKKINVTTQSSKKKKKE